MARIGGDEFVMFLPGAFDWQTGKRKIEEIQESLRTVMISAWGIRGIRASIGAALCPEDGLDYETLFKAADEAMYLDKEQSKTGMKAGRQERKNRDRDKYHDTAGGTGHEARMGKCDSVRRTGTPYGRY